MAKAGIFAPVICLLVCQQARPIDKEGLLSKYKDKFVVVMAEGVATGICSEGIHQYGLFIYVKSPGDIESNLLRGSNFNCGAEPARKGEVLEVTHVGFGGGGRLVIGVRNVSPHAIDRGIGAFSHQSLERGTAAVEFRAGVGGKDLDAADQLAALWFKPFDTAADAAKLGNTASGVFVNQIKVGMTFAEVEQVLGVPQTRVDLGEKILYKYKEMTVEFHDGKVTDAR
jgi:hypothetical protein